MDFWIRPLMFASALALPALAAPYDAWTSYREVTVNTTGSGAAVTGAVNNFPLLVRLTNASAAGGSDVLTGSLSGGGADVRFTDSTGATSLSFQLERWSASGAEFWVKVPVVAGNKSTKIRMYWGKASETAASSGPAVFDTANDWRAVYHMNGGTAATELDATIHGVTLSASDSVAGAVPGDTVGAIGRARMFAGDSLTVAGRQYFVAANSAANPAVDWSTGSPHTMSAWVYARSINPFAGGNSIFNKGDRQYAFQVYGGSGAVKKFEAAIYTNSWRQIPTKNAATAGSWIHLVGTWSGGADASNGTAIIYVNGVPDSSAMLAINTPAPTRTFNLFVGANPNSDQTGTAPGTPRSLAAGTTRLPRFWNGYLDEVSLSRGARSADFVKLSYETQKAGASAVTLGASQSNVVAINSMKAAGASFILKPSGQGLLLDLGETGSAATARLALSDMRGHSVWSRTLDLSNSRQAFWNGAQASSGLYTLRVTLADAQGKTLQVMERKVPFSR